ncbi:hypothetical protein EI94DRAFT_1710840 [Lactarius quietus]|nr:hypothetical protein EI94DRAFT_1710840 [Lactarius quietus]
MSAPPRDLPDLVHIEHAATSTRRATDPEIQRPNQHLPFPPNDLLRPVLSTYFHLGMNDKEIASSVMDHFDPAHYGLSVITVCRRWKEWGLESTRQQKHTLQSIVTHVNEVKKHFPNRGAETIRKALLIESKIRVPRPIILEYLRQTEPEADEARRYKKFKRRTFIAIGPNEMWCLDQHDKFKRYGFFFHVGLDPYPGVIHGCKVWWTVRNPKLITHFYINAARAIGGIPLITQSDPGTENVNVTYAQTALHHSVEPSLNGTIQHRWFRKHGNIKPEIHWSKLLDRGVDEGYYDIGDPLKCLLFRFIFIPYIQWEVDAWVHQRNWTKHRADCKKVLPNGIPMIVLRKLHKWKAADYKIALPSEAFDEMENKYAPPNDPVFDLVPHAFAMCANAIWTEMGSPEPQFSNAWDIYLCIHDSLCSMALDEAFEQSLSVASQLEHYPEEMPQDVELDEDEELLVNDDSEDESNIPIVDLMDNEEVDEDLERHGIDQPSDSLSTPFGAALHPTIDDMFRCPTSLAPPATASQQSSPALMSSMLQGVTDRAMAPGAQDSGYGSPSTSAVVVAIHVLTNPASFRSLLKSHRTIVAMLMFATCGPCKMIKPVFEDLMHAKSRGRTVGRVAFVRVDLGIGMSGAIARQYSIAATPTFSFVLDGKRVCCQA